MGKKSAEEGNPKCARILKNLLGNATNRATIVSMVKDLRPVAGIYLLHGYTYGSLLGECSRFYIGESGSLHTRVAGHQGRRKKQWGVLHGPTARAILLLRLPYRTPASVRRQHENRFICAANRMGLELTNSKCLSIVPDEEPLEVEATLLRDAVRRLSRTQDRQLLETRKAVEAYMRRRYPHAC